MIISTVNALPTPAAAPNKGSANRPEPQASDESARNPGRADGSAPVQQQLQTLKNRDREVRAHELAHQAVGGRYVTRGARYDLEKGPDGRLYAVGGDVSIDSSPVPGDPQATLAKAQVIQRAALAPANPSATDRQVAARASAMIQQARIELALQAADNRANDPGSQFDAFA
jgi:hypothetical protein